MSPIKDPFVVRVPTIIEWIIRALALVGCFVVTPFIAIPAYGILKIAAILVFNGHHPDPLDAYVNNFGKLG